MNLREAIKAEHSKAQAQRIVAWIGNDEQKFAELVHLFLKDEYRVVQRSAWILSMVGEIYPSLLRPYLSDMVERMDDDQLPVAVKRNVLRVLQHQKIPSDLHGLVMEKCFQLLALPNEAIAVRVFAMTVLQNLAEIYPDIKGELQTIIEDELAGKPSAAFKSRAKKVLKHLNKKKKKETGYICSVTNSPSRS